MGKGKKAMLEVSKMKMTPALSAEHQRKWDESRWECKLDDPERNYDKSRAHLNFEVRKGGVIAPVDQSVCIKEKVDARIAEWKAERLAATGKEPIVRSTQHLSVSLVIGGNCERMNELAFGNQVLQERGNNAHIKRMPEIEQFALDNYKALAERIGHDVQGTFGFISRKALQQLTEKDVFTYDGITWRKVEMTDSFYHVKADTDGTEMWIARQGDLPLVLEMRSNPLGIDWKIK